MWLLMLLAGGQKASLLMHLRGFCVSSPLSVGLMLHKQSSVIRGLFT